jgi:Protein of unknown function (DUF3684)
VRHTFPHDGQSSCCLLALNISAEVLRLVYTGGSEKKPPPRPENRPVKVSTNTGFFSSLFSSLGASTTPVAPRTPSPLPPSNLEAPDPMAAVSSHVILTVFCGEVEVSLTQKMTTELHRSTKKNPPTKMKLELIYVCTIHSIIGLVDKAFLSGVDRKG